jgi:hypothetical protein
VALSPARVAAVGVLGLRVAYGAGLLVAPERLARRWLGPTAADAPVQVPLRGLGVREIVLHAGAIAAAVGGRPVRPWLVGSIAGDLSDIAATFAGRGGLPGEAPVATAVVAGASAAISAAVAVAVDA